MPKKPNIIFLMFDQLVSQILNAYDGNTIDTPNIDRLAAESVTFDNMISTCPVCTPYRSMWLTGRHPQTTGHLLNFMKTRHDEIGWGDVFSNAGYDTGYIGKWHLHTGSFPQIDGSDYVPQGRDRLGFRWWRGYNFHTDYFNGTVNLDDWHCEKWDGYETDALNRYAFEFLDNARDKTKPFNLMINPHQPHVTQGKFAPDKYYDRLPTPLPAPPNYQGLDEQRDLESFKKYLAMVLACDDMLGELLDGLDQRGLTDSTIFVLASDHGTHMGSHNQDFWGKKMPWEENVKVPMIIRYPGVFDPAKRCETLTAPVDLLPTFCSLCNIPIPKTVEGLDLSKQWKDPSLPNKQDAVLMMNFCKLYDHLDDGWEWRGVRTKTHTYTKFLDGKELLYDNIKDPQQNNNLADNDQYAETKTQLNTQMTELMKTRNDTLAPASSYKTWFDNQRRVIANAYGPLPNPEAPPNWNLL